MYNAVCAVCTFFYKNYRTYIETVQIVFYYFIGQLSSNLKMGLLPSPTDKPFDGEQIEKEYLRVPKFALRTLGFWPHDKLLSIRVLPLTILSLTIITLGVISEVSYSYTHIKNLPLALDALCPALTKGVTAVKFVMLLLTRSEVAKMLDDIKHKWMNGSRILM